MPQESVVVEEAEKKAAFDWQDYVEYIPISVREPMVTLLRSGAGGFKRRVGLLERVVQTHRRVQDAEDDLVASLQAAGPRGFPKGRLAEQTRQISAYERLLDSLSEAALRLVATENNVSYDSYMKSGDKSGLISAILEESS